MPNTGGYSGAAPFRTGGSKNSTFEIIHQALNEARGTAYNTEYGSIIWAENYAYAKAITAYFETARTFACNLNPTTVSAFLSRYEVMLGIIPNYNDTESQRIARIATIFQLWSKPATFQNTSDLISVIAPSVFVGIEHYSSSDNLGSVPGGVNLAGGVNLPSGDFVGPIATVIVRLWQPRTPSGQKLIADTEFNKLLNSYNAFLDNYLPAYVAHETYYYSLSQAGTVSISISGTALVGVGTSFTSTLTVGDQIEVVDTNNKPQTLTISVVTDNTHATVSSSPSTITASQYRILGFELDVVGNLDTRFFDRI